MPPKIQMTIDLTASASEDECEPNGQPGTAHRILPKPSAFGKRPATQPPKSSPSGQQRPGKVDNESAIARKSGSLGTSQNKVPQSSQFDGLQHASRERVSSASRTDPRESKTTGPVSNDADRVAGSASRSSVQRPTPHKSTPASQSGTSRNSTTSQRSFSDKHRFQSSGAKPPSGGVKRPLETSERLQDRSAKRTKQSAQLPLSSRLYANGGVRRTAASGSNESKVIDLTDSPPPETPRHDNATAEDTENRNHSANSRITADGGGKRDEKSKPYLGVSFHPETKSSKSQYQQPSTKTANGQTAGGVGADPIQNKSFEHLANITSSRRQSLPDPSIQKGPHGGSRTSDQASPQATLSKCKASDARNYRASPVGLLDNNALNPLKATTGIVAKTVTTRTSEPMQPTSPVDEADLQLRGEATKVQNADPPEKCSKSSSPPAIAELPRARQVERILGKHIAAMHEDNEYWTKVALQRAQQSYEDAQTRAPPIPRDDVDWFAGLQPLELTLQQKKSTTAENNTLVLTDDRSGPKLGQNPITWNVPCERMASITPDVPGYAHYVGLRKNLLAPNMTNLHCWPYFGDEFDTDLASNLKDQYNLDIEHREEKLALQSQAEQYAPYVGRALEDLGCSWADLLRYLIEERPKTTATTAGGRRGIDEQLKQQQIHNFDPTSERSIKLLSSLPASNPETEACVADLCDNFKKLAKFDIWHVARRSEEALASERDETPSENIKGEQLRCRICLQLNCPYHGELNEYPESGSESETTVDSVIATDVINPPKTNYRSRVEFPPSPPDATEPAVDFRQQVDKRPTSYWQQEGFSTAVDEQQPFYPCYHPGETCKNAECSCYAAYRPCEKTCGCSQQCSRRFQGCSCANTNQQCLFSSDCACWQNHRECDPDLCGACGVCEVVDPVNHFNEEILDGNCRNCWIQRGVPKQTLLGESEIHGFGLYACEDIRKHDFVGEYKGEVITTREGERRGAVYEHQKLSYLFTLNRNQEIDSTYFGNKIRFINHAGPQANLIPRIVMVDAVHRIALYARFHIKTGQELLFDYGPNFPGDQLDGSKEKKAAPHVRNTGLIKGFKQVVNYHDDHGNLRTKSTGKTVAEGSEERAPRSRGRKKLRGGARVGRKRKALVEAEPASSSSFLDFEHDAGSRLAAFNISDDGPADEMNVDEGDDDEYTNDIDEDEEDESDEEDEYASDESGRRRQSESDTEDDSDDDQAQVGESTRTLGIRTRRTRR